MRVGCFFVVFMVGVATTMANAFTTVFTTSCRNVDFSVNDSGGFYVRNTQMPPGAGTPPGVDASSSISGSGFHLTATGSGYSDAGIVLFFNSGIKLNDLQGVSVVSTGSNPTINLWLDTSGDGHFFAFDSAGLLTGLNGDSYGSGNGATLNATSSIFMQAGDGAGQTYTLAQLQSGVVPGIDGNTPISLWIGITNSSGGPSNISSVTVSTVNGPVDGGCSVSAPSVSVPTLTEWGIIIFMLAAGLGSVCHLRKRRRRER